MDIVKKQIGRQVDSLMNGLVQKHQEKSVERKCNIEMLMQYVAVLCDRLAASMQQTDFQIYLANADVQDQEMLALAPNRIMLQLEDAGWFGKQRYSVTVIEDGKEIAKLEHIDIDIQNATFPKQGIQQFEPADKANFLSKLFLQGKQAGLNLHDMYTQLVRFRDDILSDPIVDDINPVDMTSDRFPASNVLPTDQYDLQELQRELLRYFGGIELSPFTDIPRGSLERNEFIVSAYIEQSKDELLLRKWCQEETKDLDAIGINMFKTSSIVYGLDKQPITREEYQNFFIREIARVFPDLQQKEKEEYIANLWFIETLTTAELLAGDDKKTAECARQELRIKEFCRLLGRRGYHQLPPEIQKLCQRLQDGQQLLQQSQLLQQKLTKEEIANSWRQYVAAGYVNEQYCKYCEIVNDTAKKDVLREVVLQEKLRQKFKRAVDVTPSKEEQREAEAFRKNKLLKLLHDNNFEEKAKREPYATRLRKAIRERERVEQKLVEIASIIECAQMNSGSEKSTFDGLLKKLETVQQSNDFFQQIEFINANQGLVERYNMLQKLLPNLDRDILQQELSLSGEIDIAANLLHIIPWVNDDVVLQKLAVVVHEKKMQEKLHKVVEDPKKVFAEIVKRQHSHSEDVLRKRLKQLQKQYSDVQNDKMQAVLYLQEAITAITNANKNDFEEKIKFLQELRKTLLDPLKSSALQPTPELAEFIDLINHIAWLLEQEHFSFQSNIVLAIASFFDIQQEQADTPDTLLDKVADALLSGSIVNVQEKISSLMLGSACTAELEKLAVVAQNIGLETPTRLDFFSKQELTPKTTEQQVFGQLFILPQGCVLNSQDMTKNKEASGLELVREEKIGGHMAGKACSLVRKCMRKNTQEQYELLCYLHEAFQYIKPDTNNKELAMHIVKLNRVYERWYNLPQQVENAQAIIAKTLADGFLSEKQKQEAIDDAWQLLEKYQEDLDIELMNSLNAFANLKIVQQDGVVSRIVLVTNAIMNKLVISNQGTRVAYGALKLLQRSGLAPKKEEKRKGIKDKIIGFFGNKVGNFVEGKIHSFVEGKAVPDITDDKKYLSAMVFDLKKRYPDGHAAPLVVSTQPAVFKATVVGKQKASPKATLFSIGIEQLGKLYAKIHKRLSSSISVCGAIFKDVLYGFREAREMQRLYVDITNKFDQINRLLQLLPEKQGNIKDIDDIKTALSKNYNDMDELLKALAIMSKKDSNVSIWKLHGINKMSLPSWLTEQEEKKAGLELLTAKILFDQAFTAQEQRRLKKVLGSVLGPESSMLPTVSTAQALAPSISVPIGTQPIMKTPEVPIDIMTPKKLLSAEVKTQELQDLIKMLVELEVGIDKTNKKYKAAYQEGKFDYPVLMDLIKKKEQLAEIIYTYQAILREQLEILSPEDKRYALVQQLLEEMQNAVRLLEIMQHTEAQEQGSLQSVYEAIVKFNDIELENYLSRSSIDKKLIIDFVGVAIEHNNINMMQRLYSLVHNRNLPLFAEQGTSLLSLAIEHNAGLDVMLWIVEKIRNSGGHSVLQDKSNYDALLLFAASCNSYKSIASLLLLGADPNAFDGEGKLPIALALEERESFFLLEGIEKDNTNSIAVLAQQPAFLVPMDNKVIISEVDEATNGLAEKLGIKLNDIPQIKTTSYVPGMLFGDNDFPKIQRLQHMYKTYILKTKILEKWQQLLAQQPIMQQVELPGLTIDANSSAEVLNIARSYVDKQKIMLDNQFHSLDERMINDIVNKSRIKELLVWKEHHIKKLSSNNLDM